MSDGILLAKVGRIEKALHDLYQLHDCPGDECAVCKMHDAMEEPLPPATTPKADAPPTRVEAEPRTCENCGMLGPRGGCLSFKNGRGACTYGNRWTPRPAPPVAPTEVEHTCANCGTKCYANGTWPQVVACAMGIKEIRDRWTPRGGIPGGAKGGTR